MANMMKILTACVITMTMILSAGCTENVAIEGSENVAPDFQLVSLEGEPVSLSDYRGHPVLLNFWATWCGPCRAEMPYLQAVHEDPAWVEAGLAIVAVNLGESDSDVRQFAEDFGLTFTILLDSRGLVGQLYNAVYIPTTYVIDENGIIVADNIGSFSSKASIDHFLNDALLDQR